VPEWMLFRGNESRMPFFFIRGHKVLLSQQLAELYGVETQVVFDAIRD